MQFKVGDIVKHKQKAKLVFRVVNVGRFPMQGTLVGVIMLAPEYKTTIAYFNPDDLELDRHSPYADGFIG